MEDAPGAKPRPPEHPLLRSERSPRAPAAVAAAALAVGILASARAAALPVVPIWPRGFAAAALAAPAIVNVVHGRGRSRPYLAVAGDAALLASLALAGTVAYDAHHRLIPSDGVAALPHATPLTLTARVVEVRPSMARGTRAVVATETARASGSLNRERVCGLLWVSWPDAVAAPARGDRIELECRLEAPRGRRNPGAFDFAAYLRHRRIFATARAEAARVLARPPGPGRAQEWVARIVERRLPDRAATLMLGLLLGRTSELPDDTMEAFRRSGTVHILSVSGLHVGFIFLIANALLRSARVPPKAARLACIPCLVSFAVLIGPGPPVVRSTAMAVMLIAATSLERSVSTLNAVGAAALGILALDPGAALDLGFQLSFGATLGIVLLYVPARDHLPRHGSGWRGRTLKLADAAVLSTFAQLAVAPTMVATTGQFSIIAPLANLVIVPLSAYAVAAGIAMLALDRVPALAAPFSASAWASLELLLGAAHMAGQQGWAVAPIAARFAPAAALAVLTVGLALRGRVPRVAAAAAGGTALAVAVALALTGPGRGSSRAVFFDVGQGDATLLELPGRHYVLIDAGPAAPWMRSDAGRSVVVPHLHREGVTVLDALVITHGHDDHVGGAAAVIDEVRVRLLVLPSGWERSDLLSALVTRAKARGAEVLAVERGRTLRLPGVDSVAVFNPPAAGEARDLDENDLSIVFRAGVDGVDLLFTGDAGRRVDELMLERGGVERVDVLKVAHHGSPTSSTAPLLARARPAIAVVCVGEGNDYGHPDAGVLERLCDVGAVTFRTDLDGAVVLCPGPGGLEARGISSGRTERVAGRAYTEREAERPTTTSE